MATTNSLPMSIYAGYCDDDMLRALRSEASDTELTALCDAALAGDVVARAKCAKAIVAYEDAMNH